MSTDEIQKQLLDNFILKATPQERQYFTRIKPRNNGYLKRKDFTKEEKSSEEMEHNAITRIISTLTDDEKDEYSNVKKPQENGKPKDVLTYTDVEERLKDIKYGLRKADIKERYILEKSRMEEKQQEEKQQEQKSIAKKEEAKNKNKLDEIFKGHKNFKDMSLEEQKEFSDNIEMRKRLSETNKAYRSMSKGKKEDLVAAAFVKKIQDEKDKQMVEKDKVRKDAEKQMDDFILKVIKMHYLGRNLQTNESFFFYIENNNYLETFAKIKKMFHDNGGYFNNKKKDVYELFEDAFSPRLYDEGVMRIWLTQSSKFPELLKTLEKQKLEEQKLEKQNLELLRENTLKELDKLRVTATRMSNDPSFRQNLLNEHGKQFEQIKKILDGTGGYPENTTYLSFKRLFEPPPPGTANAIYAAAENGNAAQLSKLVKPWSNYSVLNDYVGEDGDYTPLMIASYEGHIECVRVLANQPGIELNKGHRKYHGTALFLASLMGHVDIVEFLCSLPRINVNNEGPDEQTPYSIACQSYNGPDTVERKWNIRTILKKHEAIITKEETEEEKEHLTNEIFKLNAAYYVNVDNYNQKKSDDIYGKMLQQKDKYNELVKKIEEYNGEHPNNSIDPDDYDNPSIKALGTRAEGRFDGGSKKTRRYRSSNLKKKATRRRKPKVSRRKSR